MIFPKSFAALFLLLLYFHGSDGFFNWRQIFGVRKPRQSSPACRFTFRFTSAGQSANLDSPNYPNNYPANADCQYFIESPIGTTMKMQCGGGNPSDGLDFNVENSNGCVYDMFYMSLSGDSGFRDQTFACGRGSMERQTSGNKIAIGFRSDASDPPSNIPFRFRCRISVVGSVAPPAPDCNCGIRNENTRIVGGKPTSRGEFPWRCVLYSQSLGAFCGCSIISQNWVLTAAHCTHAVPNGEEFYVDVGDYDLSSNSDAQNEVIKVEQVVENSAYSTVTQDSDTSLLKLSTPLTFRRDVQPVCLPWKYRNADFAGTTVTASGWGTTSFGGTQSMTLLQVDLPVLSTSQCKSYYPSILTDNMICTYSNGKDTCQGDSGGSIDYHDPTNGRYYAIGIVSWGVGCAGKDKPGVYAKITNFLDWIEQNTGDSFCKA